MISLAPLHGMLGKVLGRPVPDVLTHAQDRWEIAPGGARYVPAAISLPGQVDRIRGTNFAPLEVVLKSLQGDVTEDTEPTLAYRLRDVDLVDGVLYKGAAQRHLRTRNSRTPAYRRPPTLPDGVLYESWVGNRWFGNWLSDDCLAYPLAQDLGEPVTTAPAGQGHVPDYEDRLGMTPRRIGNAHFETLTVIDDFPNNPAKSARARRLRATLIEGLSTASVPGVFILRGTSGDARLLENEREIAERLERTFGFTILDPATSTVDQIVTTCAQAQIVAGVEGSHLVHGLVAMPPKATLLVIQPPYRVTTALKIVTDRQDQRYAYVVAEGDRDRFRVDFADVARTLDLV